MLLKFSLLYSFKACLTFFKRLIWLNAKCLTRLQITAILCVEYRIHPLLLFLCFVQPLLFLTINKSLAFAASDFMLHSNQLSIWIQSMFLKLLKCDFCNPLNSSNKTVLTLKCFTFKLSVFSYNTIEVLILRQTFCWISSSNCAAWWSELLTLSHFPFQLNVWIIQI